MTGRRIQMSRGFKLKGGKLVKSTKHRDVSMRLKQQTSRRVRVARRTLRT